MYPCRNLFADALGQIRAEGRFKQERVITSPQSAVIRLEDGSEVINFCANNYLGLADSPVLREAAKKALDQYGFGMSSVRFICGTLDLHKRLEAKLAGFLGLDDCVLYSSCFDANGGLFEALLDDRDVVISDELNHASIIDGVRLCKAGRMIYPNSDLDALEACLKKAARARIKLVATDGVFSMDGIVADLKGICGLAGRYGALVMVDDSHATGVVGDTGRGSPELNGVAGKVDIVTGTFGKALGGASGGFTCTRKEIAALLRQKSRPYLFSNTLAPMIAATTLKALETVENSTGLLERLGRNTGLFRSRMAKAGFQVPEGTHPIVPVLYGDEALAAETAEALLPEGIYAVAFSYPVVPRGKARIRVQLSAAHTAAQVEKAVTAFGRVRERTATG
ncbi:MAG: glycine C-acetyltransferase [Candidatus Glassbacteria bacterium]|nr:glycine C-acetyltransferase [Candidatus Glassbacteria bacterium]